MKSANEYAYPIAFVRALRSFLLNLEGYEALLKTRDEEDAIRRLSDTAYSRHLSGYGKGLGLSEIDHAIFKGYYEILEEILRIRLADEARMILEITYARHESSTLKTILRLLYEGAPSEEIMRLVTFIGRYDEEYVSRLLKSKTLRQLFSALEDPTLRKLTLEKVSDCESLNSTLPAEVAIDKYYLTSLWNTSRFKDWDRNNVKDIVGTDIDISNITIALRCKHLDVPFSSLRELLIPVRHRLGDELDMAIETTTVAEAIRTLGSGYYSRVLSSFGSEHDHEGSLLSLEVSLKRYFAERCSRVFLGYPFGVAPLLAYLNLKYLECLNIRKIILGKRDRVPDNVLRKLIIFPMELPLSK
ncbi:MAG: V-type ATPase subunit [Candidatus Bathyarchaeia archaeon]